MKAAKTWSLIGLGFGLVVLSQTRWGVPALAWVAPAPLLAALRGRSDRGFGWTFAGLTIAAWSLVTLKIVTAPLPLAFAFAYGIPLALVHLPPFFVWRALVKRGREAEAVVAFAASTALVEWAQAELTPFGVWGATPATQVGQLAVLQVLAVAGMPGLSFLMNAVAAAAEAAFAKRLSVPLAPRWQAPSSRC